MMWNRFKRYQHWLHTQWPAGVVEKLPDVAEDGTTAIPGVRVVGDLTGIPLLKFSADTGAKAVQNIQKEADFSPSHKAETDVVDIAIIGSGVSGIAAALEAKKAGLSFAIFEAVMPFSTIQNFPKGKPIYTYPTDMTPAGEIQFRSEIKEDLLKELEGYQHQAGIEPIPLHIERIARRQELLELYSATKDPIRAKRVIIAIGRSGNYRKLGVPGEDLDKVSNRLYDPQEWAGKKVLVVGGGDSALEAAIALVVCGAKVTLSYRKKEFSRPKPENSEKINLLTKHPEDPTMGVQQPKSERVNTAASAEMRGHYPPGSLTLELGSTVELITENEVTLKTVEGTVQSLSNDQVFIMIGREAPLAFFRRSGIPIRGEWTWKSFLSLGLILLFFMWMYHWKGYGYDFPFLKDPNPAQWSKALTNLTPRFQAWASNSTTLFYTLAHSMAGPSFYYTLVYSFCVVLFGIRRIRRRKTSYVRVQTLTLMMVQIIPLFLLPEILLPWLGRNGWFVEGTNLGILADHFFERYDAIGIERAYWRSYGFILAWPLFVYNWFTMTPLWGWIIVGFLQTFVLIPLLIYYFGKGAYCGWICSCGALAETLGDTHRHKMPHGAFWNRLNMLGQFILAFAFFLLSLRILAWAAPEGSTVATTVENAFSVLALGKSSTWHAETQKYSESVLPFYYQPLSYRWTVDLLLAGVFGFGMYFHFSGRMWCRFACPLAALMHLYARFSRFRIFAEKSKCISCNVCTSVCHQGIDIMNFANKGRPMEDPECVRCSACVQSCPTGVLSFGRLDHNGNIIKDRFPASLVQAHEKTSSPSPSDL